MLLTPKSELDQRLARLQTALIREDLGAALLLEASDLFYFTGTGQQAYLFVPAEGQPLLMVKKSLSRARTESSLERIEAVRGLRDLPSRLWEAGWPKTGRLGLEMDVLPAAQYLRFQKGLAPAVLADVSDVVRHVRMIKSPYELGIMRRAAGLAGEVLEKVRAALRPGMREIELAALLEYEARQRGHQGTVRMRGFNQVLHFGHVLAGASAAVPSAMESPTGGLGLSPAVPHGAGYHQIAPHQPVLVDFVMAIDGYLVDQTRILCLGKPPTELARAHQVALDIEAHLAAAAKPGVPAEELFALAQEIARGAGLSEHFMGYGPDRVSFVGHGIGLELDELPPLARGVKIPLEAGVTLALEPKFTFPGQGVVGIEDTYVVTEKGAEALTRPERGILFV
ncbi:MAG: Xaa-Pro peptidase family protein [Firmicutes bacterium]|nr:Xaa-Pro peptidase family protein [Bacillota bacterium]